MILIFQAKTSYPPENQLGRFKVDCVCIAAGRIFLSFTLWYTTLLKAKNKSDYRMDEHIYALVIHLPLQTYFSSW